MQIIDGKRIAEKIKDGIVAEVLKLKDQRPNLAIILVGEREDSKLYVSLKEKQAKTVGVDTHVYRCEAEISEEDLLMVIDHLNKDELIDGILLQLPLPAKFDTKKVVSQIAVAKDIDGFHPDNLAKFMQGEPVEIEPLLITVVNKMLDDIQFSLEGKTAAALVNSEFFGKTVEYALAKRGAKAAFCYSDDPDLSAKLQAADLLVTALGKPNFVTAEMVKPEAVVIDIGITKTAEGQVVGDVDFASVKDKVSYITPVPGGVGPMTIAVALDNTLKLHQARIKDQLS